MITDTHAGMQYREPVRNEGTTLFQKHARRTAGLPFHIVIGLSLAAILMACSPSQRTPDTYLIPVEYRGWVRIQYNVPDTPELRVVDGRYEIVINGSGWLRTSSQIEKGWARDEYYFCDGERRIPLTHPSEAGPDSQVWGKAEYFSEGSYVVFFVGTREEYLALGPDPHTRLNLP